MKRVCVLALGLLVCCTGAFAFDVSPTQINTGKKVAKKVNVNPEFLRKIFNNKSLSDGIEMLTVTDDGERLSSVRGTLSSPLSGDLAAAARAYIDENSDLFNLPKNRNVEFLKLSRFEKSDKVTHVAYQMVLDGVPVYEAKIELHLDADGVVTLANGSLPEINEIVNQINLSKYQAIGAAKKAIKAEKLRAIPDGKLQIVARDNGTARVAYVTKLAVENPLGDWKIIVDAENADIIDINNEMNFKTGLGAVYLTNPLKSEITQEPLYHLTTNTLTGLYAKIENDDGPESVNEDDVHIYDLENTHFEEVGMYNYITTIHGFFKKLGHDKLDKPMRAVVHMGTDYDNAYFSPWQQMLAFGDGNKFNSLAREASIAYHEYSHAVLHSITYLAYSAESGAINEGQADYFACSNTDDPLLGEWAVAKMGKPFLRNLENDLHYPEDIHGEVHADGKIWGAALWDIQKAIGKEAADLLIYKSHFYLNGSRPTFMDGYNALVTADKNLFEGKYQQDLEKIMAKRGIVAESYNGAVLTASDIKDLRAFMAVHGEN